MVVLFLISLIETRSPLFVQSRIGKDEVEFQIFKFRTMKIDTPNMGTHLIHKDATTRFGRIMRRLKFDELPQLWNVLCGDMSLVGPRPCLPDQDAVIVHRRKVGAFFVRPGITGLAQLKSIDMSNPALLAATDEQMLNSLGLKSYCKYLALTVLGVGRGDKLKD